MSSLERYRIGQTKGSEADTQNRAAIASNEITIWKQVVDVQQHFNDLELRIRNFALAITGAFLALGGYAIKDGGTVTLLGFEISVAGIIVFAAVLPLFAFYFMDKFWYHKLLEGSVNAGIASESNLQDLGYKISLGTEISKSSPITNRLYGKKLCNKQWWKFPKRAMHTKHKMDVFYGILFISVVGVASVLGFAVKSTPQPTAEMNGGTSTESALEAEEVT